MTQHVVKINKTYFDAINNGVKNFAILRDKEYRVGDTIKVLCVDNDGTQITIPNYKESKEVELRCYAVVLYIEDSDDYPIDILQDGYVVVGFKKTVY